MSDPPVGLAPRGGARQSAVIFAVSFAAFLYAMPPTLPPYRDAGEMAASAWTLGVSHPPSYPLYILTGHLSLDLIPLGVPAWRLGMLSALAASAALALLFACLSRGLGALAASGAVLLLAADATFWSTALVPEMYSLSVLFAVALLTLALRLREDPDPRLWDASCLLYGLFLGNRTDLVLWAPGLLWLVRGAAAAEVSRRGGPRAAARSAALLALGLSIYLYLPLRSLAGPWLDWNHPSTPGNLIGSLTRRGYGGTLDTLSKSYSFGELFLDNVAVYAGHLWRRSFGPSLLLSLLGLAAVWRRDRELAVGHLLAYAASGPLFLLLANLPPNPHAMAIVEPHYLLSDLVLAVWAAHGVAELGRSWGQRAAAAALAAAALLPWAAPPGRWGLVERRGSFAAREWSLDAFRSTPPGAVLVAKKDVQLFSLWYHQTVEGRRPDLRLVAQGLSGSPWYQGGSRRRGTGLKLGPLRERADWDRFIALNGPLVFATMDAELPEGLPSGPEGLVLRLGPPAPEPAPWPAMTRSGEGYDRQRDFFHADLIESRALARQRLGTRRVEESRWREGVDILRSGWALKWAMPEAPSFIAYALFRLGRLAEAAQIYEAAVALYGESLALAARYRSLPDVTAALRRGEADAHLNLGVIRERQGDKEAADGHYQRAIALNPVHAQAHYNRAVLHWGREWAIAAAELEEVLRLDPRHAEAARYLAVVRRRLGR